MSSTDPLVVFNQISGEDKHAYEGVISTILQDIYAFRRVYHPAGSGGIVTAHNIVLHDPDDHIVKIKSHDEKSVEIAFVSRKSQETDGIIAYKDHRLWVVKNEKLTMIQASEQSIPTALMVSSALNTAVMARIS